MDSNKALGRYEEAIELLKKVAENQVLADDARIKVTAKEKLEECIRRLG